jgi:peroxiredoxin
VNRPRLVRTLFVLMLLSSAVAMSTPMLPRNSPELSIDEPGGKNTMLSSFKGKVVVLEFLFVRSQHCLRVARVLNQLQHELGSRGLQAVGIAFDAPNAAATGGGYLSSMVESLQLTYPVGYSQPASVDGYLGRTENEMLSIPQIVIIDRLGMIRAVNGGQTNPTFEDAGLLRLLLEPLLKESPPNTKSTRSSPGSGIDNTSANRRNAKTGTGFN